LPYVLEHACETFDQRVGLCLAVIAFGTHQGYEPAPIAPTLAPSTVTRPWVTR
jgi:hypothetical protein